jgi:hypothetical protein
MRPDSQAGVQRWLEEFEYIRNGTLDLLAFLDVNTGRIHVECRPDHTIPTFLEVFRTHASAQPADHRLDYIMDNLDAHCSYAFCQEVARLSAVLCPSEKELDRRQKRREWLEREDKRIVLHFTPFHGSWLNQVEIWFGLMTKKCLKSSYEHPDRLRDAVNDYAAAWNSTWAHPFAWKYDGDGLHQKAVERFTAMLTDSAERITLQFLTKSSLLMINLRKDYASEIPPECWKAFAEALCRNLHLLKKAIDQSTQPVVKANAEAALSRLLSVIAPDQNQKALAA